MTGWTIVIREPGKPERSVPARDGLMIGRNPRCSCVLSDPAVSGRHARIVAKGADLVIEDLGSQNKTRILGGPALSQGQSHPLQPGTEFRLGETILELRGPHHELRPETATTKKRPAKPAGAPPERPAPPQRPAPRQPAKHELGGDPTVPGMAGMAGMDPNEQSTMASLRPPVPTPPAKPARPAPPPPPQRAAPGPPPRPPGEGTRGAQIPASNVGDLPARAFHDPNAPEPTIQFGPSNEDGPYAHLATESTLRSTRARVVLAGQADRGTLPILSQVFTIGRGADCECRISHPAVSTPHAKITFDTQVHRFFLEDTGSRNHTYLQGKLVPPGSKQELVPDAHMRFGPVDALFVVDIDPDGVKIPDTLYLLAGQLLARSGSISAKQLKAAMKQAAEKEQHLGEVLLLDKDPISVKQWTDVLEQARVVMLHRELAGRSRRVWLVVVVVAILLAVIWFVTSKA